MSPLRIAVLALAVGLLAACSRGSQQVTETTVEQPPATSKVEISGPGPTSKLSTGDPTERTSVEVEVAKTLSELQSAASSEGTIITLPETVLFDFGKADLKPDASPTLDKLPAVINFYAQAKVSIRGHTDSKGSDPFNQDLSQRRATAVRDYLAGRNVDAGRLEAKGFGSKTPVAPNTNPDGSDNPDGRQRNRRVEIVLEGVQR